MRSRPRPGLAWSSSAFRLRGLEAGCREAGGDGLGGFRAGSGWGDEEGAAVVLQLADGLHDVDEGAVGEALLRLGLEDEGVPAAGDLLDVADVDLAVLQVAVEGCHVAGEEG